MLPVTLPEAVGSKLAVKEAVCPGLRVVPEGPPLTLKPAPETVTPEIVTLEVPLLVSVTARLLPDPTFTFPKLRLPGFAPSRKVAATAPVPLRGIDSGEPGPLLVIEILPLVLPEEAGENLAVKEVFCPALRAIGSVKPLKLKPVPLATP
jgi:hypothetical protein